MDDRPRKSEDILAVNDVPPIGSDGKSIRRKQKFGGRRSVWPGALALILGISAAIGALVYWGTYEHKQMLGRQPDESSLAKAYGSGHTISDGQAVNGTADEPLEVTNPVEYKDMKCAQIDYISKNNKIYTVSKGKESPLVFKGVNWLGLEGWDHVITGLWDGPRDGNSFYRIAKFLSDNKFNAVRFPLDIDSAARNIPIRTNFNTNSQRALASVKTYVELITRLSEGLGQFKIAVLLDFNTRSKATDLNPVDQSVISVDQRPSSDGLTGNGWENVNVRYAEYEKAIVNLATAMCDQVHWNVVGIDIKDAPAGDAGQWDGEEKTSWQMFASKVGSAVVKACPTWLVFAQGLNGKTKFGTGLEAKTVLDWPGSTLRDALTSPINVGKANKLVYAPPFWSPSVYPAPYFFKSSEGGSLLTKWTSFTSQTDMDASVGDAMKAIFGDLLNKQSAAIVLSSFGGLFGEEDMDKGKASTKAITAIVAQMTASQKAISGGFWWSLNPDNRWPHPAPDSPDSVASGLLDSTWRKGNSEALAATKLMDKLPGLAFLPCDPR
ncbi:hypothetical protein H310_04542 [Aphanomyces invadans]|uniref:Uncharacterized protein n=1 Tax=Aphanomyces invadans TaxID=157072 RepID=A0A024UEX2_9STRA|nr:hypothetical protein H310_04542 [Aphanomyces invadans]ETW04198.1 hypothetical protein H310_04542 [Aphanomyces invadans]|eukprot:XP_008867154.1 hypothetical protein H310_04542 [Aphanomyces invadans]